MSHLDSTATLRVILAGRTGLDAALRRDPTIELIRARSLLEALGELSEPIDDESPSDCVLIIGSDVQSQARPTELAASVRIINARCPVLLATEGDGTTGYDGAISPKADSAKLRSVLSGLAAAPAPTETPRVHKPMPVPPPAKSTPPGFFIAGPSPTAPLRPAKPGEGSIPPVVVTLAAREQIVPRPVGTKTGGTPDSPVQVDGGTSIATPAIAALVDALGDPLLSDLHIARVEPTVGPTNIRLSTTADDRDMTTALLAGHSILPVATELLRQRNGAADLAYFPPGTIAGPGGVSAPVALGGKAFGQISSAIAGRQALDDGAAWLGGWLILRDVYAEMRRSALTDPLTGAYNRRYLDRFLSAALEQSRSARHNMSVLMLDVDNFKTFNDRYGHSAGDEILTEIVKLLRAVVRDDDRVCRAGGDEFVVVFYEPRGPRDPHSRHPDTAEAIAERFQKAIASHRFPKLAEQAVGHLTVSGGLATFPWEGLTATDLLAVADQRLLESKKAGKNVIRVGKA